MTHENMGGNHDAFLQKFGKHIKQCRERKCLTQESMADGSNGMDYKYYQRIEYGKVNITLKTILKIAEKLEVHPRELFDFDIDT